MVRRQRLVLAEVAVVGQDQLERLLVAGEGVGEQLGHRPQVEVEVRPPLQPPGLEVELQVVVRSLEEQVGDAVLVVEVAFPLLSIPPCLGIHSPQCRYPCHVCPRISRFYTRYGSVEPLTSSCPLSDIAGVQAGLT